jgi:hypothetical protein
MIVAEKQQRDQQRQKARSIAIGLALGALVVVFYLATIVRLGPNAVRREGPASSSQHGQLPAKTCPGGAATC